MHVPGGMPREAPCDCQAAGHDSAGPSPNTDDSIHCCATTIGSAAERIDRAANSSCGTGGRNTHTATTAAGHEF